MKNAAELSDSTIESFNLARRKLFKGTTVAISLAAFPQLIQAATKLSSERHLELVNLHTNEKLSCCYWANGSYIDTSLNSIDYILRDHRTEDVIAIDRSLLDVLHTLRQTLGSQAPFHIISGYRSAATNKKLRKQGNGVAKRSLHMQGKAVDIRLPDVELSTLRDTAIALQAGGVGYYIKSNFVHLDVGRPRSW